VELKATSGAMRRRAGGAAMRCGTKLPALSTAPMRGWMREGWHREDRRREVEGGRSGRAG
jgi:hypothetical protein